MHLSLLFALALLLLGSALPTQATDFVNAFQKAQNPIVEKCRQITRTKIVTRTSHEINVVSTIYRQRTHGAHAIQTPHPDFEPEEQRLIFGVEGSGCDKKACTICRMLNNCSEEEKDCTSCDLAYYCNQCPQKQLLSSVEVEGLRIQKTCSLGPDQSISCDEAEEAIPAQHEVFYLGGR